MSYKLIIFDLDGTLLDTSRGIFNGLDFLSDHLGREHIDEDIKPTLIGPPLIDAYANVYGLKGSDLDGAMEIYRKYYNSKGYKEFDPYDGLEELLKKLKENNYFTAVATMKNQVSTDQVIENSGYSDLIDFVKGNSKRNSSTKADLLNECLDHFGIKKEEALLIGDTNSDAKGAQQAGIDFVPALYGYGYSHNGGSDDYPYVFKIKSPLELLDYLERS